MRQNVVIHIFAAPTGLTLTAAAIRRPRAGFGSPNVVAAAAVQALVPQFRIALGARPSRFAEDLGDAACEFATGDGIGEELHPEVEVDGRPFFAQRMAVKNLAGFLNHFIRHEHGHLNGLEPQRINVARVDGVGVDDNGLAKVNGFEEGVSEAFIVAGIGNEVGMRVDVKESVDLLAIGIQPTQFPDRGPR